MLASLSVVFPWIFQLGEVDRRIAFGQLKRFLWRELQHATENFSEKNVLGQGGFGKVYKGVLSDGTKVAVKRLTDYESPGGDAAFQREVEMISVAVHRNLLRLIGFCTTQTERMLVYPFMQNLSVAYRLRGIRCFGCFLYYIFNSFSSSSSLSFDYHGFVIFRKFYILIIDGIVPFLWECTQCWKSYHPVSLKSGIIFIV